jgi:hypothetical protein
MGSLARLGQLADLLNNRLLKSQHSKSVFIRERAECANHIQIDVEDQKGIIGKLVCALFSEFNVSHRPLIKTNSRNIYDQEKVTRFSVVLYSI